MPPDREVEFGIDLLLELAFVSIPPYKMAPTELKESMTHGFLDKKSFMHKCHLELEQDPYISRSS